MTITANAFARGSRLSGIASDRHGHDVNTRSPLAELSKTCADYVCEAEDSPTPTFHRLPQDFVLYYGVHHRGFREAQVRWLATVVNNAVAQGGDLGNAFRTCFLEHLGQVSARKPLSRFLSATAKSQMQT